MELVPPTQFLDMEPLDFAARVARSRSAFRRPDYPERPPQLEDDGELYDLHQKWVTGQRLTPDGEVQLQLLGEWRRQVFAAEGEAAARLRVLLGAIRRVEEAGHQAPVLREYVSREYRRHLPEPISSHSTALLADSIACDLALLPRHLRTMGRPPEREYRRMSEQEAYR